MKLLNSLRTGWSFIRVLRIVLAGFVVIQAYKTSGPWWMYLVAAALIYQSFFGACSTNGRCAIPDKKKE